MKSERQAAEILADAREAGYESIEMCGYLMDELEAKEKA